MMLVVIEKKAEQTDCMQQDQIHIPLWWDRGLLGPPEA